jgi:hypothetical protein
MLAHAMHPKLYYFRKGFYMHGKLDMQPICTPMLAKFYSCKKGVLHFSMRDTVHEGPG